MCLDNTEREPVLRATATDAVKLTNHDGTSFIAITTTEGLRRFFMSTGTADQFAGAIRTALASDGLKPLT